MAPKLKAVFLVAVAALSQPTLSSAFSVTPTAAGPPDAVCDRRAAFLKTATFVGGVLSVPTSALAKDVDPAVKGTKSDPKYQACLSQCIYDCTKPKGDEQKSRGECIPECKQKCATSKEQLMMGTPKKD